MRGAGKLGGHARGFLAGRRARLIGQGAQEAGGDLGQEGGRGLVILGGRQVEHQGKAARRGRCAAGREREGEEFQQVEGVEEAWQVQALGGGGGVDQERRGVFRQRLGDPGAGQCQDLAIGGEQRGAAVAGDQSRRLGQQQARANRRDHARNLRPRGAQRQTSRGDGGCVMRKAGLRSSAG
jgi:hypothetical protein